MDRWELPHTTRDYYRRRLWVREGDDYLDATEYELKFTFVPLGAPSPNPDDDGWTVGEWEPVSDGHDPSEGYIGRVLIGRGTEHEGPGEFDAYVAIEVGAAHYVRPVGTVLLE